jgi:hypothetical protein
MSAAPTLSEEYFSLLAIDPNEYFRTGILTASVVDLTGDGSLS